MDIVRTIQEAATWIEKVNPDYEVNLYRTEELKPAGHFYEVEEKKTSAFVGDLASKRSALLQQMGIELIPVNELHLYGRIALFDAWETVRDGAPEVESDFYVDVNDTPPHDTWVAMGGSLNISGIYSFQGFIRKNVLLAWVPQSKYYCVQGAIDVACLDNFEWATNESINSSYKEIKAIFTPPPAIVKSRPDAKTLASRQHRLHQYEEELDKYSVTVNENNSSAKKQQPIKAGNQGKRKLTGLIPNTATIKSDGICVYATFEIKTTLMARVVVFIPIAILALIMVLAISEGIIALLFFTLVFEVLIVRYALWNYFGKETLIINTKTITWQHDYGFFKTNQKVKEMNRRLITQHTPDGDIKGEQQYKISFISYNDNDLPVQLYETAIAMTKSDVDKLEAAVEQLYIDRLSDDYEMPYVNLN